MRVAHPSPLLAMVAILTLGGAALSALHLRTLPKNCHSNRSRMIRFADHPAEWRHLLSPLSFARVGAEPVLSLSKDALTCLAEQSSAPPAREGHGFGFWVEQRFSAALHDRSIPPSSRAKEDDSLANHLPQPRDLQFTHLISTARVDRTLARLPRPCRALCDRAGMLKFVPASNLRTATRGKGTAFRSLP